MVPNSVIKFMAKINLQKKIILLCLTSSLLIAATSSVIFNYMKGHWSHQQMETLRFGTKVLKDQLQKIIVEASREMATNSIRTNWINTSEKSQLNLDAWTQSNNIIKSAYLIDTEGNFLAGVGPESEKINTSKIKELSKTFKSEADSFVFSINNFSADLNLAFGTKCYDTNKQLKGYLIGLNSAVILETFTALDKHFKDLEFPRIIINLSNNKNQGILSYSKNVFSENRTQASALEFNSENQVKEKWDSESRENIIQSSVKFDLANGSSDKWSIQISETTANAYADIIQARTIFVISLLIGVLVSVVFGFFTAKGISDNLSNISNELSIRAKEAGVSVTELANGATDLSNASTQQAAALQETSSAIEEISSMVKRSAELAANTDESAKESQKSAGQGGKILEKLLNQMSSIKGSTDEVASQMENTNQNVMSILKLIQDVESKTKVINEIVFQTKLLSFNASVEAARAGEQGRGFAVVAEEVGNLAVMSGKAAQEINQLLDQSVANVTKIATETKDKFNQTISLMRDSVNNGNQVADECKHVFTKISESTNQMTSMVASITEASSESFKGVDEISKALQQMNAVNQNNAAVAQSCAQSSNVIDNEVTKLRDNITDLTKLIDGNARLSHFIWKDAYALGVDAMDDEHKVLIHKINSLADALNKKSNVIESFSALAEYTIKHFSNEEAYMQSIEYPQFDQHKALHAKLLNQVMTYKSYLENGTLNSAELMTFLNDWLLKHILGVDMKYARHSRGELLNAKYTFNFRKSEKRAA